MKTQTGNGCLKTFFSMGLFLLVGIGLTFWGWTILQNARASASWPTADGIVTRSEVTHSTDSDGGDSYSPKVTYRYTVTNVSQTNTTNGAITAVKPEKTIKNMSNFSSL